MYEFARWHCGSVAGKRPYVLIACFTFLLFSCSTACTWPQTCLSSATPLLRSANQRIHQLDPHVPSNKLHGVVSDVSITRFRI